MVKKILVALAFAGAAVLAQAGTLYWQVADEGGFSAANLFANNGSSRTKLGNTVLAKGVDLESTFTGTETGLIETDITGYENDTYSFLVEVLTYSQEGAVVKTSWSRDFSYHELAAGGYVATGSVGLPMLTGGVNIPEPSSGLLLVLGGALMALRRRRRA